MNHLFSWKRYGLLVKRQWHSDWPSLIILMGILTVILAAIYGYNLPNKESFVTNELADNGYWILRFPTTILIVLGGMLIAFVSSYLLAPWSKKTRALEEIMLPASALEKFLMAQLAFWICLGSFLLLFFLIDGVYRAYFNHYYSVHSPSLSHSVMDVFGHRPVHSRLMPFIQELRYRLDFGFGNLLLYGWILHSLFLLGSIFFTQNPLLKSLISIAVLLIAYVLVLVKFYARMIYGKEHIYRSVSEMQQSDPAYHTFLLFWAVFLFLTAIVCLRATYLKLKEKEI